MVTPVYVLMFGRTAGEGFTLLLALSVAVMVWSPCFNTLFDWVDLTLSGRVASDRPHRLRLVHAVLHEASSVIVSLPLILWIGGLSVSAALALDLGLTVFYSVYAYVFHVFYDQMRPVTQSAGQQLSDHAGQWGGHPVAFDLQPRKAPACQGNCAGTCLGRIAAGPKRDGQDIRPCQLRLIKAQNDDTILAHLTARPE